MEVTQGRDEALERFEAKYIPEPMSGCWLWLGSTDGRGGYGAFRFRGGEHRAHRVAYDLLVAPLPKGRFVLHRCDNPPCVNPRHLFLGNNWDNIQDMVRKGRQAKGDKCRSRAQGAASLRGEMHPRARLTERQVLALRRLWSQFHFDIEVMGELLGLHKQTVSKVVYRERWKHLAS